MSDTPYQMGNQLDVEDVQKEFTDSMASQAIASLIRSGEVTQTIYDQPDTNAIAKLLKLNGRNLVMGMLTFEFDKDADAYGVRIRTAATEDNINKMLDQLLMLGFQKKDLPKPG